MLLHNEDTRKMNHETHEIHEKKDRKMEDRKIRDVGEPTRESRERRENEIELRIGPRITRMTRIGNCANEGPINFKAFASIRVIRGQSPFPLFPSVPFLF